MVVTHLQSAPRSAGPRPERADRDPGHVACHGSSYVSIPELTVSPGRLEARNPLGSSIETVQPHLAGPMGSCYPFQVVKRFAQVAMLIDLLTPLTADPRSIFAFQPAKEPEAELHRSRMSWTGGLQ